MGYPSWGRKGRGSPSAVACENSPGVSEVPAARGLLTQKILLVILKLLFRGFRATEGILQKGRLSAEEPCA